MTKRSYKSFDIGSFLTDVHNSNLNEKITSINCLEEASKTFEDTFKGILDNHAPIKIFQTRKNYLPYLSEYTKELIQVRNRLKETSVSEGPKDAEVEAKKLGKVIRKAIKDDKRNY